MAIVARSTSVAETFLDSVLPFPLDDGYDWISEFGTNGGSDMASTSDDEEELISSDSETRNSPEPVDQTPINEEESNSKQDSDVFKGDDESQNVDNTESIVAQTDVPPSQLLKSDAVKTENKPLSLDTRPEEFTPVKSANCLDCIEARTLDVRPKEFNTIKRSDCKDDKPLDVRPKEFGNKHYVHVPDSGVRHIDSKSGRKKKIREKNLKKWKPVDLDEMGFHISLLPASSYQTEDYNNTCTTENISGMREYQSSTPGDSEELLGACGGVAVTAESSSDPKSATGSFDTPNDDNVDGSVDSDDYNYFVELGIDVTFYTNADVDIDFHVSRTKARPQPEAQSTIEDKKQKSKATPKSQSRPSLNTSDQMDPFTLHRVKKHEAQRLYELECSSKVKMYCRVDRDRKTPKIHKEIKSKNCKPVLYNPSRKDLYMHHRLYKLNGFMPHNFWPGKITVTAMPKQHVNRWLANRVYDPSRESRSSPAPGRPAPVQNLNHALDDRSRPEELSTDLVSFLINLQHRELTPEDYDMLLRLDDSVKPKTVSDNFLDRLKTEVVEGEAVGGECAVCMDPYVAGDKKKFLPCGHHFHAQCIDTWLTNSSTNCPLDGLPVESS